MGKRLPRHIKIGYADYRIRSLDPQRHGSGVDGICNLEKHEICIWQRAPKSRKAETVLHELLHAIHWEWKLPLNNKTEEKVISALSAGIATVIRDNHGLIELIAQRLYGNESKRNPASGRRTRKRRPR